MVRMRAPSQSLGDNSGSGSSSENNDDNVEVLALIKPDILNDLRESQQRNGGETLPKLLYTQRTAQCTDPRDRVYGLLGLLRPQDDDDTTVIKIRPDYTKPTWEVYADAMSHIFSTGQGPYFLSGVFLPGLDTPSPPIPAIPITGGPKDRKQYRNQQKAEGHLLPSWVPDLSRQVGGQATQPSGLFFHPPAGRSASGAGAICKNGWRVSERVLKVEGLSVDTIHEVLSFGASTEEVVGNLPRFENATKQAIERSRAHPEHEPDSIKAMIQSFGVKEPLWRTLISNRRYISGYDDAPSVYEDMYLQLRLHPDISASALQDDDNEYRKCLAEGKANKSFFTTTSSGLVGTCVPDSRAGDTVAILFGSPTPFVLRPLRVEGDYGKVYALIGGCYTGGIMDGEMVDELYCEDLVDSVPFYIT
ncbi:hypothetical protein BJY00DRAFT_280396 [Aspergillus carlsbadensis]|nr:hypothetical protein BJY00DRAFT_280396 [Aspergillus carlsbadensis]